MEHRRCGDKRLLTRAVEHDINQFDSPNSYAPRDSECALDAEEPSDRQ